jgi:hypothetical protein
MVEILEFKIIITSCLEKDELLQFSDYFFNSILKRKEGDIAPCLKNLVLLFVE